MKKLLLALIAVITISSAPQPKIIETAPLSVGIMGPMMGNVLIPILQLKQYEKLPLKLRPRVDILINTPGGMVDMGELLMAQMRRLSASGTEVRCIVGKYALSMGAFMLPACSVVYVMKGSQIMWHRVKGGCTDLSDPYCKAWMKRSEHENQGHYEELRKFLHISKKVYWLLLESETWTTGAILHDINPKMFKLYDTVLIKFPQF